MGISFPKRLTQLEFLKRNISSYVCKPISSRERDAVSRGHTSGIPATLASFLEADAGSTSHAFMLHGLPAHDVSPIHWSNYTHYSERDHAEGVPKAFDSASRSLEELGLHP